MHRCMLQYGVAGNAMCSKIFLLFLRKMARSHFPDSLAVRYGHVIQFWPVELRQKECVPLQTWPIKMSHEELFISLPVH